MNITPELAAMRLKYELILAEQDRRIAFTKAKKNMAAIKRQYERAKELYKTELDTINSNYDEAVALANYRCRTMVPEPPA